MGQYTEGQRLQGSDGHVYIVRNGVPVLETPSLSKPPDAPTGFRWGPNGQLEVIPGGPADKTALGTPPTGYRFKSDGSLEPIPGGPQDAGSTKIPGDPTKTGPEYLATLPQNVRARVQQLLDGRSMLTQREKGQPFGQMLMDAANQADPTFDESASKARYAARQQFTGMGKGSQIVQAADRFAAHVNDLYNLSNKLPGPNLGQSTLSDVATAIGQTFDQKDLAAYNQILPMIQGEVQKLTKNGSATVDEGEKIMNGLKAGQPRDVRNAAIAELVSLGRAQIQPLRDAWESAWQGTTPPPMPMEFSPATQAVFDAIESGQPGLVRKQDKNGRDHWFTAAGQPIAGNSPPSGGSLPPGGGGGPGSPSTPPGLASPGDSTKSLPIPDAMQAEHRDYLQKHYGNLDPQDYAAFRVSLDKKYGFGSDPKGYADITPALNNSMKQGAPVQNLDIPPVNAKMNAQDRFNASAFNNPIGAGVLGAGSLGGGADELAAALKTPFNGLSFDENLARANGIRQASAEAFPKSTFAGNVAGTIGDALALGGAVPAVSRLAMASPVATGIGFGALNGALENNDNRIGGAVGGAALGGVGGAVGRYVAAPVAKAVMDTRAGQAVSNVVRPGINRALGMFGSRAPQVAAVSDAVNLQPWERALPGSQAISDLRGNLQDAASYGLPYSLADASPQTRALAGSVARFSPDAGAMAKSALEPRFLGQADRAVQAIDTNLAPITNVEQRGKDLLAAGDQAAGPYYNLAFERAGPVDPQIAAMLDTPAGRASLAHARTIAANRGLDPNKVGFDLNQQGDVVLKSVPSFETLQLVKRGLDTHLNSFADEFGNLNLRGNPLAQSVLDLKNRFNTRLGELNPNYAEGNSIWAGFANRKNALDQGYGVLPNNSLPFRQFQAGVSGLNADTLPEAQMGFATNMADTVNRARLSTNPYNSIYGSPLQQQKVATMFPQGASAFDRIYNLEKDMGETYGEVLKGSQTQPRAMADAQFTNEPLSLATDAAMGLATGGHTLPISAARIAGPRIRDRIALGFSQKKADALAPVLFNTDPQATLDLMDEVALRKAQDAARAQAFGRRYGMFGAFATPNLQGP